jgi:hypothetical protein
VDRAKTTPEASKSRLSSGRSGRRAGESNPSSHTEKCMSELGTYTPGPSGQPPVSPSTESSSGVAERTGEVASVAKDQAASVAATSKQEIKSVAQDARAHARRLTQESADQLRSQAADQTDRLAESLRDVSRQLQAMARGEAAPQGMVADLTQQLAAKADASARRLQNGGLDGLVADLKRFARNRPGLFLAASAGAGFVATRLLRSTDTKSLMDAAKSEAEAGTSPTPTGQLPSTGQPQGQISTGQQSFDRVAVAPNDPAERATRNPTDLVAPPPPVPTW